MSGKAESGAMQVVLLESQVLSFGTQTGGATGPTLMLSEGSPPGWPVRIPGLVTLSFGAR